MQYSRRQIPLTSFTLLTVPEEPMIDVYLKTKQTIDISFAKTMSQPDQNSSFSSSVNSDERAPKRLCVNQVSVTDHERAVGAEKLHSKLERALYKFMSAVTATESPDGVIKTIATSKSSKLRPH